MPRLLFIRPGETDFYLRDAVLGRHDADLSDIGRLQAKGLAQALAQFPISFLGVSPLKRAIATAMIIEDIAEISPHPIAGFHGADMGDWDTREKEIIQQCDGPRYQSWMADPDFRAPGGESTREIYARAYPDLARIVNEGENHETFALVLQESVMQALCCAVLDLPLEAAHRFHLDHGAFGRFERMYPSGPYRLISWNQRGWLSQEVASSLELAEELPGV